MTLQTQFENFLGGREAAGSPIPKLDASVGRKLLGRIDQLQWHLNRYSVELNYLHAALGIDEFLSLARSAGFDGAQFHITRSGPRMGLTAESDQYLAALAEQKGARRLTLTLDISTTGREEVNDAVRVARALGADTIRCYCSVGGTLKEIILAAIEQLKYAAELGSRWSICFLLEQHERLTGSEILEIIDGVDADRSIGALFDFANPVPANRSPLEDLYEMRKVIRGAHSKDVIILPGTHGQRCIGVRLGEGDLPLSKIYFDLLMLGDDTPQVKFIAVQNVVGYVAPAGRLDNEPSDQVFLAKSASRTPMSSAEPAQRLARERQDVFDHINAAKLIVNKLRGFATDAVFEARTSTELGPEASCARAIEEIGRQLYGDARAKRIWRVLDATDESELGGVVLGEQESRGLLRLAVEKHRKLLEGCP
jgi:sugar phosphate isomerase/epimerase